MILMIQKEVAIKFDYNESRLNKFKFINKLVCEYKRCFNVPPTVFKPKPKVNSTVVKFKFNNKKVDFKKIENFIGLIFKNKRKKINGKINLKKFRNPEIGNKRVDELTIEEILKIYNFFYFMS